MSDSLEVDTNGVAKAASQIRQVQQQVAATLSSLQDNLDALGKPWRFDSYGSRFADGPKGYVAASANLLDGGRDMTTSLGGFADAMTDAVAAWRKAENDSAGQFD